MHVDERGTAFMALGHARGRGLPAVWITTSGTAVANGYPAVVEASQEGIPLILLTADRPPELRDTDANQTIRQERFFGEYVRWFMDLPVPTDSIDPCFVLSTMDQAVHRARKGPVHLNCMFREPLAPSEVAFKPALTPRFVQWQNAKAPFTSYASDGAASIATLKHVEAMLKEATRPLIILGRLSGDGLELAATANQLCHSNGAVFLSDVTSQTRLGLEGDLGIPAIEAVLYGTPRPHLKPDLIVQFGATPLSKRLSQWISSIQPVSTVVIDHRERRIDPGHNTLVRIESDPLGILKRLSERTQSNARAEVTTFSTWQDSWRTVKRTITQWHEQEVVHDPITEPSVANVLSSHLAKGQALTVASSNSIRHVDSFASSTGLNLPVLANRGASGIDGTLASGVGFALSLQKRPVILLGDLALMHDLNSLELCARHQAVVVVVNNDGGGIFSYLPIRDHTDVFEPVFGTPHGRSFAHAAALFELAYSNPDTLIALANDLDKYAQQKVGVVIEVNTDREDNLAEVRRLLKVLNTDLDSTS